MTVPPIRYVAVSRQHGPVAIEDTLDAVVARVQAAGLPCTFWETPTLGMLFADGGQVFQETRSKRRPTAD